MRVRGVYRYTLYTLSLLMLLGCQSAKPGKSGGVNNFLHKSSAALGLLATYEGIKRDYENGRIMRARKLAMSMEKTNKDYAKTRWLLRKKIEPARQRLLSHYLSMAKKAENSGLWHKAALAYEQAKDVSLKPEKMEKARMQMELKLRQVRLDALLKQQRAEDEFQLRHMRAYEPPAGVSPEDEVFLRKREEHEDALDRQASLAYRSALRFLRKDMPEVAYVEIESYLRLQPDSDRGRRLMQEIKRTMPKQLVISGEERDGKASKAVKPKPAKGASKKRRTEKVSADQIRASISRGEWLKAKAYALTYRREGGKGADALLTRILTGIKNQAASEFARGGEFFRQEQLDKAIIHWRRAVELMPDEAEYVEALRRARQLKERLNLLRQEESSSSASE